MSFVRPSRVVHSLLLLSVFGCSGKDPEPVPEATLPEICEQDSDCDDGLFCNGEEECRSTDEGKSCFFGEPPCAEKQDCDERDTQCVTNCELTTDADGDGSIAQECGGADCDDGDSNRYPGNTELCDDGHDEDCDPCTVGERTARDGDKDRDGHLSAACTNTFDPDGVIPSCPIDEVNLRGAEGIVAGRDCNDDNDAIRPGANETCNGVDDDCDGELDDGLRQSDYYPDCDGDGQGDSSAPATPACAIPVEPPEACADGEWEEEDHRDCDDTSATVFVGAPELCDDVDNNCNGLFEVQDSDNDGFSTCEGPRDCDDQDALIFPGAAEEVDGIDNDCNGLLDAPGEDEDGDGAASVLAGGLDCDDLDDEVVPGGAPAICRVGASYACDEQGQVVFHDACTAPSRQRCAAGGCLGMGKRVFVGPTRTCAILIDDSLKCWGAGGAELGQQDTRLENRGLHPYRMGDSLRAIPLGEGLHAVEVALAINGTCALLNNGQVKCWGREEYITLHEDDVGSEPGQLGDALEPIDFGASRKVTQIVAGELHVCALLDDASVKCWGHGANGRLGRDSGETSAATDMSSEETTVKLGTGFEVTRLAAGPSHTCALSGEGNIKCWGSSDGAFGRGDEQIVGDEADEMGDALPIVDLGSRKAVDLSTAAKSTCALMDDQRVVCWGSTNATGLGHVDNTIGDDPNEMGDALQPVMLGTSKAIARLESGEDYHCALFEDQSAKCWGNNASKALGGAFPNSIGTTFETSGENMPYLDLGGPLADLSASGETTCGLLADTHEVLCIGDNESGKGGAEQTGVLTTVEPHDPATLKRVALGSNHQVTQISVGSTGHWFGAVLSDGQVKSWGRSQVLGHESQEWIDTTRELTGMAPHDLKGPALQVVGNGANGNACVLLLSGEVQCWGADDTGVLGGPAPSNVGDEPGEMGEALGVIRLGTFEGEALRALSLVAGEKFVCALLEDATVKCWGKNRGGVLGIESGVTSVGEFASEMGNALQRVDLGDGARVKSLAANTEKVCALLESGEVKCWGAINGEWVGDEAGEMGDNLAPVSFSHSGTVSRIAAIENGVCALYEDGVLSCSTGNPPTARTIDLGAGSPIVDIQSGERHGCVLLQDGRITCWGMNHDGAIGTGQATNLPFAEFGEAPEFINTRGWRPVVQIAAGSFNTCALQDNGRVKCWGRNAWISAGYDDEITVPVDNHLGNASGEMGANLLDLNVTY